MILLKLADKIINKITNKMIQWFITFDKYFGTAPKLMLCD